MPSQTTQQPTSTIGSPPARPASILSSADTLVQRKNTYRGFPSEEAYLTALREWVDSKMYFETKMQLHGFYGTKTVEYYANQPGLELGKRRRERKMEKEARRMTVAQVEGKGGVVGEQEEEQEKKESKFKKIFGKKEKGRRMTVV